jgi:peptidoglycan/LPS O-acetylase OafA/YrhL
MYSAPKILINNEIRLKKYLPTLDGWRAIAIALVIFSHGSDSIKNAININIFYKFPEIKMIGLFGVRLFFGLSGFLITSRLINDEICHGKISIKSFYIRRGFRILPAAIFFLIAVGLLSFIGVFNITVYRWLSAFFFMENYSTAENSWYLGHFWSLAVEEHFYLIWPAVFLLMRTNNRRIIAALIIVIFISSWRVIDFKYNISGSTSAIFWGRTDIQADGILWGVLIALLYADSVFHIKLKNFLLLRATIPMLFFLLFGIELLPKFNWKVEFLLITIKAIIIPITILGTVIRSSAFSSRILESFIFRSIGRLSFSLYLWQQLFFTWDEHRIYSFGFLQIFPYNLLAAFSCAIISMTIIEKPFIKLGNRVAKKITGK